MARAYACLILAACATGAAADCTVPALDASITDLKYSADCFGAATVAQGITCTILDREGYTCVSPGLCKTDDTFTNTAPTCAANTCTVPTVAVGVETWSAGCTSGQTDVKQGVDCLIAAKTGYTCTSPGKCNVHGKFPAVGACILATTTVITTTLTPWDSSESSSAEAESLESSYSSSFKRDSSADSSGSDDSSGSTASGSSGSYLQQWQWIALALLICVTCGILAALAGSKKPKKKKAAPKPAPEPVPEVQLQPLMPLAQPQYAPVYSGYPGTVV